MPSQRRALGRHPIEVRGEEPLRPFDVVLEEDAEIAPAEVVAEDEEDVRGLVRRLGSRGSERKGERQGEKDSGAHLD